MSDDFDLDDDDFGLGDLDDMSFDSGDIDGPPKGRSPVERIGRGFLQGAKDTAMTASFQQRLLDNALPPGYSKTHRDVTDAVDFAKDLYDTASKSLKPAKSGLKKLTRNIAEKADGILPKGLKSKIDELTEPETSRGPDVDYKELEISETLKNIFGAQVEADEERSAEEERVEAVKQAKDDAKFTTTADMLNSLRLYQDRLVSYQDTVTVNFQRKSLELQYKHYFVAREQFTILEAFVKETKSQLDSIVHNSALPDMVKMKQSEVFKEQLRERIYGNMAESVQEYTRGIKSKVKDKIKSKVKELGDTFSAGVQSAADMQEMMADMEGVDSLEVTGGAIGSNVLDRAAEWLGTKAGAYLKKNDRVKKTGDDLEYMSNNKTSLARDKLKELANWSEYDEEGNKKTGIGAILGNVASRAAEIGLEFIPGYSAGFSKSDSSITLAEETATWSLLSDRTLNEIIPGYLSSILQELEMSRTGIDDLERVVYNFEKGSFTRESDLKKDILSRILPDREVASVKEELMEVIKLIDPKSELSDVARESLTKQMLMDIASGIGFNPQKYFTPNGLREIDDPDIKEEIIRHIAGVFFDNDGKFKDNNEATSIRNKANNRFTSAKGYLPEYKSRTLAMSSVYGTGMMNEMGLFTENEFAAGKSLAEIKREEAREKKLLGTMTPEERIAYREEKEASKNVDYDSRVGNVKGLINTMVTGEDLNGGFSGFKPTKGFRSASSKSSVDETNFKPIPSIEEKIIDIRNILDSVKDTNTSSSEWLDKIYNKLKDCCKGKPDDGAPSGGGSQPPNDPTRPQGGPRISHITDDSELNQPTPSAFSSSGLPVDNMVLKARNVSFHAGEPTPSAFSTTAEHGPIEPVFPKYVEKLSELAKNIYGKKKSNPFTSTSGVNHPPFKLIPQGSKEPLKSNPFGPPILSVKSKFSGIGDKLNSRKNDLLTKTKSKIDDVKGKVRDKYGDRIDTVVADVNQAKDKIATSFNNTVEDARVKIAQFDPIEFRERIKGNMYNKKDMFKEYLEENYGDELDKIKSVKDSIKENIGSIKDDVKERGVKSVAGDALRAGKEKIGDKKSKIVDYLKEQHPSAVDKLSGFKESIDSAKSTLTRDNIKQKIEEIKQMDVKETLSSASENIKNKLYSSVQKSRDYINDNHGDKIEKGVDALNRTKDRFSEVRGTLDAKLSEFKESAFHKRDLLLSWLADKQGGMNEFISSTRDRSIYEGDDNIDWLEDIKSHLDDKVDILVEAIEDAAIMSSGSIENKENKGLGVLNKMKDRGSSIVGGVKNFFFKTKDKIKDIYVNGIDMPALETRKLKLGLYRDKLTNKIVKTMDDITGPVIDWKGRVVLSLEDIKDGLVTQDGDKKPKGRIAKIVSAVTSPYRFMFKKAGEFKDKIFSKKDSIKENIGSFISNKRNKIKDVYIKGKSKLPVLKAIDLEMGLYRDRATGAVIRTYNDIKGAVEDQYGNIVISESDIKNKLLTTLEGHNIGGKIRTAVDSVSGFASAQIAKVTSLPGKLMSSLKEWNDRPRDIYVAGEKKPRLYATLLSQGYYVSRKTKLPITQIQDIDGEVEDIHGNVVLSSEDLKQELVDSRGKKVKLLKGLVGGAIGLGVGLVKSGFGIMKNVFTSGVGIVKKFAGGVKDFFTNGWKLSFASSSEKQVELLENIYGVLEDNWGRKSHDNTGDGFRDGSWQAQLAARKKKKEEESSKKDDDNEGKDSNKNIIANLLSGAGGLLGGLLPGGNNQGGGAGDALSTAADAATIADAARSTRGGNPAGNQGGGRLRRAGRGLWRGAKALGRGAARFVPALATVGKVAGFLGKGALLATKAVAGVAAGVLSAPVLIGAAAIAAVAVAGWLAYKYLYRRPKGPIHRVRLAQYGIDPENKDQMARLSALEKHVEDDVVLGSSPNINAEDDSVLEFFGVNKEDEVAVHRFSQWYNNRFKPVYLKHRAVAELLAPNTTLIDVDSELDNSGKLEFINQVKFPVTGETPYNFRESPFENGEPLVQTSATIQALIQEQSDRLVSRGAEARATTSVASIVEDSVVSENPEVIVQPSDANRRSLSERVAGLDGDMGTGIISNVAVGSQTDRHTTVVTTPIMVEEYSGSLYPLLRIRMKTYGLNSMDRNKIAILLAIEAAVSLDLSVSGRNVSFNGYPTDYKRSYGHLFGVTDEGPHSTAWLAWFVKRFIPTLLAYAGAMHGFNKTIMQGDSLTGEDALMVADATAAAVIGNGVQISVWNVTESPWRNYILNNSSRSVDEDEQELIREANDMPTSGMFEVATPEQVENAHAMLNENRNRNRFTSMREDPIGESLERATSEVEEENSTQARVTTAQQEGRNREQLRTLSDIKSVLVDSLDVQQQMLKSLKIIELLVHDPDEILDKVRPRQEVEVENERPSNRQTPRQQQQQQSRPAPVSMDRH